MIKKTLMFLLLTGLVMITGCEDVATVADPATPSGSETGTGGGAGTPTNKVRMFYDCDFGDGLTGQLQMDVEAVGDTGIIWGSGSNPDITGVVGTGSYTIYIEGFINMSDEGYIVFTGENSYVDFTHMNTYARFRTVFSGDENGTLWINSDPTDYTYKEEFHYPCTLTNYYYL